MADRAYSSQNPFRALGLATDSSIKTIRNRIEELRQQIFFGTAPQGMEEHDLQAASFILEDPVRRFQAELQWLLWSGDSDSVAPLSTIADLKQHAIFLVRKLNEVSPAQACLIEHDLALISGEIVASSNPSAAMIAGVYLRWSRSLSSSAFGQAIHQRASERNDPRLTSIFVNKCLVELGEFAAQQSFRHVTRLDLNAKMQLLGAIQSSPKAASLLVDPAILIFEAEQRVVRAGMNALSEMLHHIRDGYLASASGVEDAIHIYSQEIMPYVSPLSSIDPPIFSPLQLDELARLLGQLGEIYIYRLADYRRGVFFLRVAQTHAVRRSFRDSLERDLNTVLVEFFLMKRDEADEQNDLAGYIAALELASAHTNEPERSEFREEADYLRFRNSDISGAAIEDWKETYWQILGPPPKRPQPIPIQTEQTSETPASYSDVTVVAEAATANAVEAASASETAESSASQDADSSEMVDTVAVTTTTAESSAELSTPQESLASSVAANDQSTDTEQETITAVPPPIVSASTLPEAPPPTPIPPPPTDTNTGDSPKRTQKSRPFWHWASAALLTLVLAGWYWIEFGESEEQEPTVAIGQSTLNTVTPRPRPTRRATERPTTVPRATAIPTLPPTIPPTSSPETAIPAVVQPISPTAVHEMVEPTVPLISEQFDENLFYSSIAGSAAAVSYNEGELALDFWKPGLAVFRHIVAPEERSYRLTAECSKLRGANGGCLLIWLPARQEVGYQIVVTWASNGMQAQVRQFLPGADQIGIPYSPSILIDPVSLEADMSIIAKDDEIQFEVNEQVIYRFPTSSLAPTSVGFGAFMSIPIDSVSEPISVAFRVFRLEASEQRPIAD